MDFVYELEQLEKGDRSAGLILKIIEKHKNRSQEIKTMYERYKASKDGVPIFTRPVSNPMNISNALNNDFFSEIIDIRTGYFAGNEINYIVNKEAETAWREFAQRNRLADIDSETTKHAGIGGYATRLLYIDSESKKDRIAMLPAWETVLLGDKGIDEPKFGLHYYTVQTGPNEYEKRAELYEANKSTTYSGETFETLKQTETKEHVYTICPMWAYMNNDELQGEAEKVIPLIDGYDNVMSDVNSEIEAFRSAYLAFFGVTAPEPDDEDSFKENGTFYFEDGQDGKFLTKVLQTEAIEAHLDRLQDNIYLFTKTPNFKSKEVATAPSGIALKHMMQPLENKTVSFERKFVSSNIRMFEILASSFEKRRVTLKPYEVEQKFTRNTPKDMLYEAQVQTELKGNVPEVVRLSIFPGIQDAAQTLKELEAEQVDPLKQFEEEQKKVDEKLGDN